MRNPARSRQKLNVYSYYGSTKKSPSKRSRGSKNRLARFWRTLRSISLVRIALVLVGVVAIATVLSVNANPIVRFEEGVLPLHAAEVYRTTTSKVIKSSIFNRSKLTFDYSGVENKLKSEMPEITDVSISFDLVGRSPVVSLSLQPPTYRVKSAGKIWVIDNRGVVIAPESTTDRDLSPLPLITDEIGLVLSDESIGKSLLSPGEVEFLGQVMASLKSVNITPDYVYIPATLREIDIQLSGESWRYKLNTSEQGRDQAGALLAARETLSKSGQTPTEYVDLRAGEKVFWR